MELADPAVPASPPDGAVEAEVAAGAPPGRGESVAAGVSPGRDGKTAAPGAGRDEAPEYCPLTLAALIDHESPMPAARALDITAQVLRGLEHLHAQGLMHRDVKPSNVLVVGGQIKRGDAANVLEFGGVAAVTRFMRGKVGDFRFELSHYADQTR
jgi:hypothetical protein